MNKTYISIIIVVLVVGGLIFMFGNKKLQAPTLEEGGGGDTGIEGTVLIPAANVPPAKGTSVVREFTVSGKNFSFTPNAITIKKGDKVKITFKNTAGFHDFKIDEYGLATKQAQAPYEEVLEFIADKVGSFEYYCSVGSHRSAGMKGTLTVE